MTGVREFRRDVPKLVQGKDLVLVTWHGRPQSVLLPLRDIRKLPRELRMEFLRQSGREIQALLQKRGITEEKILSDFEVWRKAKPAGGRHASRRRR